MQIAHLLDKMGYRVELTRASKNGGYDIRAFGGGVSQSLLLVGCKKRAPGYGVVVEIVRGLRGVVNDVGASGGMIATTSYFTRGAKELAANNPYRMALNDHQAVLRWIAD